jgi:hypothetical protein
VTAMLRAVVPVRIKQLPVSSVRLGAVCRAKPPLGRRSVRKT